MCLYFRSFSTWHGRVGVYVQDIWVEQRFRGAGVGEALLQRCAALTRAEGGAYLRLAVDVRESRRAEILRRGLASSTMTTTRSAPPMATHSRRWPTAMLAQRARHGMKAFYADEQKRHDPKAFLSSGAPQPNPEKPERVERLLAGAQGRGLRRSPGRKISGWGRSPPSTRRNISISWRTFSSAGSASRARRPK